MPFENNLAERATRLALILRKHSDGNQSGKGADLRALLMRVFFTLKNCGHNPVESIDHAIKQYLETDTLPPLQIKKASERESATSFIFL